MHNSTLVLAAAAILALGACAGDQTTVKGASNPLLETWTAPFGAPPLDTIRPEHFQPAFDEAIRIHNTEIAAITAQSETPTFANTIEALERSGELLERIRLAFVNLNDAHTSDALQAVAKVVNPLQTSHKDDVLLNEALFERVAAVYEQRDTLDLDTEQQRLLDKSYQRFVRGGANLDDEAKAQLRALNSELSTLSTQFGENVLKEMNSIALLITDESDLEGLPQSVRDAAAAVAEAQGHPGAWAFNLQRTSWTPFLQLSERRDLREQLFTAYTDLGAGDAENGNLAIAARIAALRTERAQLLGFESHAAYVLDDNMAKTPERVAELLDRLWTPALARAEVERAEMQALADERGDDISIAGWDWWYYAEKLRAAKYSFDEEAVKPYLQLDNVRQAAFDVANKLWGLRFVLRNDVPVYHPDVQAFEVQESDGSLVGLFYVDYFARESKRGGAWMENYRQQWKEDGVDVRPIIVNVCNFSKPSEGQPALLSLDEAGTLFHEFGHAVHGLLADGRYASLSGTNVARDFVELPSQMMENWAFAAEVLPTYALHVETGEPIPQALIDKLQSAKQFNQGFETTEYLAASILDLEWHTQTDPAQRDAAAFEAGVVTRIGLIPEIAPRYRTPYFSHIFSGEYSAGYYSYVWAEVLDADGFEAFKEAGIFDPVVAQSYRDNILAAGDSEEPMVLYERFRGGKPSIQPLLVRRGLL